MIHLIFSFLSHVTHRKMIEFYQAILYCGTPDISGAAR